MVTLFNFRFITRSEASFAACFVSVLSLKYLNDQNQFNSQDLFIIQKDVISFASACGTFFLMGMLDKIFQKIA